MKLIEKLDSLPKEMSLGIDLKVDSEFNQQLFKHFEKNDYNIIKVNVLDMYSAHRADEKIKEIIKSSPEKTVIILHKKNDYNFKIKNTVGINRALTPFYFALTDKNYRCIIDSTLLYSLDAHLLSIPIKNRILSLSQEEIVNMMKEEKKCHFPSLKTNSSVEDFSNIKIEVEEKLVGEMWTIGSNELGPVVLNKIKAIRESNEDNNLKVESESKKPKNS